jgi:hypothetical protein
MTMTPSLSPQQIADVLANNLSLVFDRLCEHRYGGPLSLRRIALPDDASATARFRLHRTGLPDLRVDFEIQHVGGNVYDVQGRIEDGPSRTFTYSLPATAPVHTARAPHLAHNVAAFLLDALERRVGSTLLQNEARGRRLPASSGRSRARSARTPSPTRS